MHNGLSVIGDGDIVGAGCVGRVAEFVAIHAFGTIQLHLTGSIHCYGERSTACIGCVHKEATSFA